MNDVKEFEPLKKVERLVGDAKAFVDLIPDYGEFDYFNLFPEFQEVAEEVNKNTLNLVQSIYEYYLPISITVLKDNSSLQEPNQFSIVEQLFDSIFEKLDEAIDMKKGLLNDTEESVAQKVSINRGDAAKENVVKYNSSLDKPQLSFKDPVDNTDTPFQPKLRIKHHSQIEWNTNDMNDSGYYDNPYTYEIANLVYPDWELEIPAEIIQPRPENETPLTIVEDETGMIALVETLKREKSIAVDLEHHDYRSYQGFTCLIQISTRSEDYLIDVIKAREFVWLLNEVFTDPSIMKVLHGADRDIEWLQKDFGVYVVNMFDSGQAARVLGFESYGLAFLLKRYCNVIANKEYQRADWRIRPLTANMKKYAREDTHFLLYISDELRKLLLSQSDSRNLLRDVLDRSAQLCKQSYQKPIVSILSGEEMLMKKSISFNHSQRQVFLILFYWRDQRARLLDESPQFILPLASLIKLAQMLPKTTADLPRLLHPVTPEVRANAKVLIELIKKSCDLPDMREETLMSVYSDVCGETTVVEPAKMEQAEESESSVIEESEEEYEDLLKKMFDEGVEKYKRILNSSEKKEDTIQLNTPQLFRLPERSEQESTLAEQDRLEREKERQAKKSAIDEELDVDGMFRDLAMISGMMDHEESEEDEVTAMEEEKTEEKEESIHSLKELYKKKPVDDEEEDVISLKRKRDDDIDDLLGSHEIELKSAESMKKSIGWKSKKVKMEKEKKRSIQPAEMNQFIEAIGAGNHMMEEEEVMKTNEILNQEKKKEKKKVSKKYRRYKAGRK